MHPHISELFASIFGVLESLLQWIYQKGKGKALVGAMLKPDTYGDTLENLVADVQRKSGAIEKYGVNLERRKGLEKVNALHEMLRTTPSELKALGARVGEVGKTVEETKAEIRDLGLQMNQLMTLQANVVQTIYVFMSQDPPRRRSAGNQRPQERRFATTPRPTRKAITAQTEIDAENVIEAVGFDTDLVPGDADNILRGAQAQLSTQDDRLLAEMMSHIRLQALIEGGFGHPHVPRGPVSVGTAKVVAALLRGRKENPSLYALVYFCSEHQNNNQPFGSATDLVITLLLQLIEQHRSFDSELLGECCAAVMNLPGQPSERHVQDFCHLLKRCVLALPAEATLFCVIEGIAYFERPKERAAQASIILSMLVELGGELVAEDGCARVKCLLTIPARSPHFATLFEAHTVLTMQAVNSAGFFRRKTWRTR